MKTTLAYLRYNLSYRWCMVNSYLADCRGDKWGFSNWQMQAYNAERELQILRLNKIYGALR